jgi:hypothetical protein
MMKKEMFLSVFAAIIIMSMMKLSGQSAEKETRNISGFTEIGFGIAGNLSVKTGPEFSVVLEGDKKYLAEIETYVKNNKLIIRNLNNHFFNNEKVSVYIILPELKGLGVSGSGEARIESKLKVESLYLNVSGSGKIYAPEITAENLTSSISGSGDIILKETGSVDKGGISISGSGSYSGETLNYKILNVRISGSGNCRCSIIESLDASISGSGNIYYAGNPKINARVSGSGHVRSR